MTPRPADWSDRLRCYRSADREALWELKAAFERDLGAGGDAEKARIYEGKLGPSYRERYLDWLEWCVQRDPDSVIVAEGSGNKRPGAGDGGGVQQGGDACDGDAAGSALAGYAFVLPEELSFVWDAAVLNELYVRPANRGTGLADALMEAALAVARDQDLPLERLVLDVDSGNERARSFYDRWGFTDWGEMVAREL